MFPKKLIALSLLLASLALPASAYEKLNWQSRALTAGKASLTSDSYRVTREIATPNFSPEFRFPLELVYNSAAGKNGIFGSVWNMPQLESRVFPKGKGIEWLTPWGEKILFYEKDLDNENILDIFKQEMRGAGCFAPFQDWDAKGKKGDWAISGKNGKKGWVFTYRDSRLRHIAAPSGRGVDFACQGDKLRKVIQEGVEFITLSYDKNDNVSEMTVNGVKFVFNYRQTPYVALPKNPDDKAKKLDRFMLASIRRGTLDPVKYSYDAYGFLNKIEQGEFSDEMRVANETPEERLSYLTELARLRKAKKSIRHLTESRRNINGRILSDSFFKYSYNNSNTVTVHNRAGKNAVYNYNEERGILTVTDFAGLTTKTYYFRRYDVAYNGKLRQVRDAKDRVIVNYRYDKNLGKPIRVRDMADNEIYYQYDRNGNLAQVSRSPGYNGSDRQDLLKIDYNNSGDPVSFARLDADGRPAVTTKLSYNGKLEITRVANGQTSTAVSYSPFGLPTQVTDTFLNSTSYRYDKYNRLENMTAPNGVRTHYKYDENGLVTEILRTCPPDYVKDMVRVGAQPPANSIGGEYLLSSLKIAYNGGGLPVSVSDNQGRIKTYDRDEMGRIVREQFPDDTANTYKYTVTGQIAKVLDRNRNPIGFEWNDFGKLACRETAAQQFTDYVYDEYGLLKSIVSRFRKKDSVDRKIQYTYDEYDRMTAADYGSGRKKTFQYDSWGKLLGAVSEDGKTRRAVNSKYDEFDRLVQTTEAVYADGKAQSGVKKVYAYSPYGQRTGLTVTVYGLKGGKLAPEDVLKTAWEYDKSGRLVRISKGNDVVEYLYDAKSRVLKSTANAVDTYYTYTPLGQLETKTLGAVLGKDNAIATLKYTYSTDGNIAMREANGVKQSYQYDKLGQLTAVLDASGKAVEEYSYDPAGNILRKDVNGEVTTYTYDKANQLVSSACNGKTTNYEYDAAGRLVKEGDKAYSYGWLDKVMEITQGGKVTNSYTYSMDGQIASSNEVGTDLRAVRTDYLWDGLALLKRGTTEYVNEPAVTGGNPILANGKMLFNDLLGNSLGVAEQGKFTAIQRNAFGQTLANPAGSDYNMFTGKPHVEGLGYAFLFRNYRAELGKWTCSDPLGYPDGWNNLAYVNNRITCNIDIFGLVIIAVGGANESDHHELQTAMNTKFGAGNYVQFSWDQQSQIQNYINQLPADEPIVLVGHSYGGDTAYNVADNISRPIVALVTLDPVGWLTGADNRPDSVSHWYNVYASDDNYTWNDFIADIGGQWGYEDEAINITAETDHNNPLGMLGVQVPGGTWNLVDVINYHQIYGE